MTTQPELQVNGLQATSTTSPTTIESTEEQGTRSSTPSRPGITTRKSSHLHKNVITKLRPLPFQYIWAVWHDKSGTSVSSPTPSESSGTAYDDRLTLLADSVPDIAAFYRIWNNFPWDAVKNKDSVHVFRQGVKPLWEDEENINGGCWVFKIKKEDSKALRAWEEICLLGCGGELQASMQAGKF